MHTENGCAVDIRGCSNAVVMEATVLLKVLTLAAVTQQSQLLGEATSAWHVCVMDKAYAVGRAYAGHVATSSPRSSLEDPPLTTQPDLHLIQ